MRKDVKSETNYIQPPHCKDAEICLLGGIMIDGSLAYEALAELSETDFFFSSHRKIFRAITDLCKKGSAIDPITIMENLRQAGELDDIGGPAYVAEFMNGMFRPSSLKDYIKLILEASKKRKLLSASRNSAAAILDGEDLESVLSKARSSIDSISDKRETEAYSFIELVRLRINRFEAIADRGAAITGVPSGFKRLDELLTGFQPKEMIILAARTSVGKSAMALNIAEHAAFNGFSVGYITLEMSAESLIDRLICSVARVDSHKARSGYLLKEDWSRIVDAQQKLADLEKPILISDTARSAIQILAQCRRWKASHGLDLLIVDYLQLMDIESKHESREKEVSAISKKLCAMAVEFNIPLLALCQFSRKAEDRASDEPKLSDLRESGSLEMDAHVVIAITRQTKLAGSDPDAGRVATIYVLKQRNGPTGEFQLSYRPEYTRFENIHKE